MILRLKRWKICLSHGKVSKRFTYPPLFLPVPDCAICVDKRKQTQFQPFLRKVSRMFTLNMQYTALFSLHTLFQNVFIFVEPPYIIMEYAGRGNLQLLLRAYRLRWTQDPESMSPYANAPPVKKLTSRDLTIFGLEVARGMEYIASKEV